MEFVSYDIASNDFRRAGAASRSIKEHLKRIGADAEAIRRTMIAAYEAGTAGAGVIVVTAELFANGASVGTSTIPFRPEDLPVASGIPTTYSCEGDTLTMFPPAEGAAVAPVIYVRASP